MNMNKYFFNFRIILYNIFLFYIFLRKLGAIAHIHTSIQLLIVTSLSKGIIPDPSPFVNTS